MDSRLLRHYWRSSAKKRALRQHLPDEVELWGVEFGEV
jgi:hypothetical protein